MSLFMSLPFSFRALPMPYTPSQSDVMENQEEGESRAGVLAADKK